MKIKNTILVLALALSALGTACARTQAATLTPVTQAQTVTIKQPTKPVYTCDAPTKTTGKPCKRRVREAGLVCWQHRGQ